MLPNRKFFRVRDGPLGPNGKREAMGAAGSLLGSCNKCNKYPAFLSPDFDVYGFEMLE
jgi:hypothetical protein